ncbi:hypothetical protein D9M68_695500 [compost metagenome]
MTDSLAEHVPPLVSSVTRERPSVGSGWPARVVVKKGVRFSASVVRYGFLSLKVSNSKVLPFVGPGPATM